MAGKSSIWTFLDAVSNESIQTESMNKAIKICDKALAEIDEFGKIKHTNGLGKRTLGDLKQLIQYVKDKQYKIAKQKEPVVRKQVHDQQSKYLEEIQKERKEVASLPDVKPAKRIVHKGDRKHTPAAELEKSSHVNTDSNSSKSGIRSEKHQVTNQSRNVMSSMSHDTNNHANTSRREEPVVHQRPQSDVYPQYRSETIDDDAEYRSKRASQALRQNNPNIADLSDVNRPIKVAENFSELYDNEWTDAFEELNKKSVLETKAIKLLLTIVEESYKFCRQNANKQIDQIANAFEAILLYGPDEYMKQIQKKAHIPARKERAYDGLLVQFRKGIAVEALQELTAVCNVAAYHKPRIEPPTFRKSAG